MAKKGKSAKSGKKGGETLIVQSKMKDAVRSKGCNCSSDVLAALNEVVHEMIAKAAERCKSNGRKTVRGGDF